jgi:hypothetical protein
MLPSALDGTTGFAFYGKDPSDLAGIMTSTGDVNGDGYDDLVIGAMLDDGPTNTLSNVGEAYVVFGKATGWAAFVKPALLDGTNGFIVTGIDAGKLCVCM